MFHISETGRSRRACLMTGMSGPYMVAAAHPSLTAAQFERFEAAVRSEARYFGPRAAAEGPKPTLALLRKVLQGAGTTFVAMSAAEIVGMARLDDTPVGAELWIVVLHRWRGRGVGIELARTVIDHGTRLGYSRIVLHSSHRSRAALALGKKLGLHVVDMGRGRVDLVASTIPQGVPA